jgi:hypothetical protein
MWKIMKLGLMENCLLECIFNPLNAGLNTICHLLALLGAHHILHVSRVRVKVFLLWVDLRKSTIVPDVKALIKSSH